MCDLGFCDTPPRLLFYTCYFGKNTTLSYAVGTNIQQTQNSTFHPPIPRLLTSFSIQSEVEKVKGQVALHFGVKHK